MKKGDRVKILSYDTLLKNPNFDPVTRIMYVSKFGHISVPGNILGNKVTILKINLDFDLCLIEYNRSMEWIPKAIISRSGCWEVQWER